MLNLFNRMVTVLLWLLLLLVAVYTAIEPFTALAQAMAWLQSTQEQLRSWQDTNPSNFLIAQIAVGVVAVLVFGSLLWFELWPRRRRGVRLQTAEGGVVELDTESIARRLTWHLDQLADVITVVPTVKARGSLVDVQLEIETAPDIDVPMKTEEVVEVTREILEQDMGLRLGKLDVRIRHAPFEEEWLA